MVLLDSTEMMAKTKENKTQVAAELDSQLDRDGGGRGHLFQPA